MVLKEGEFLRSCKFARKNPRHLNKNETGNKFKKSSSSCKDHANSQFSLDFENENSNTQSDLPAGLVSRLLHPSFFDLGMGG